MPCGRRAERSGREGGGPSKEGEWVWPLRGGGGGGGPLGYGRDMVVRGVGVRVPWLVRVVES